MIRDGCLTRLHDNSPESGVSDALDRLVQLTCETKLDAQASYHRDDLADSLSSHSNNLWICFHASNPGQGELDGRAAICHQSRGELYLYSDSIWVAKSAPCIRGHSHRLGNDYLVHGSYMATLQVDFNCTGSVLDLGFDCDSTAMDHDNLELGKMIL